MATALLQVACPDETVDTPDRGACPTACFFPEVCNPETGFCEDPTQPTDTGRDIADTADVSDGDADDIIDVEDVRDEEVIDLPEEPDVPDTDDGSEGDPDLDLGDEDTGEPEVHDGDLSDEEVGPSLDHMTCLELDESLPEDVIVTWCWGEDEADPDGLGAEADDPTGFEILVDGVRHVRLGFGFARSTTVQGLTPGVTYEISVAPYMGTPTGIITGPASAQTVILPEPDELLVAPLQDLALSTDPLQTENLFVALRYTTDDGTETAVLHMDSRALTSARATFSTVPEDTTVVEVSNKGAVKAGTAGTAEVHVSYSWSDVTLSTSLGVVAYDPTPTGLLELTFLSGDESDAFAVAPEFILFPSGGSEKVQAVNLQANYPLAPGRYFVPAPNFAFGEEPSRNFAEVSFVFNIMPDRTTVVSRRLVEVDVCQTVGAGEAAKIEAANGAFIDIPAGAVASEMEVCLTPLPAGAGPWRGMNESFPLLLPESYLVTWPVIAEVGPGITLNAPLATDLADYMYDQLLGSSVTVGTLRYHHFAATPGRAAELAGEAGNDRLIVEIDSGGIYQFEMCPATGENDGGCRLVYESCTSNHTVEAARHRESDCGDTALFSDSVAFDVVDVTDSGSADLSGVLTAAVGIWNGFDFQPTCEVSPCGAATCPDTCRATALAVSCGRAYRARVEQFDGVGGWGLVQEIDVHVPQTVVCGEEHEKCNDSAVCMPNHTQACGVSCIDGY